MIDSIFTDGPFEVFTTVELNTDENGEAVLTINPSKPGTYISIVQAKAPHPTQNTLTGLGGSISVVTNGSLSVSGMDHVADFSGFPVYSVDTEPGSFMQSQSLHLCLTMYTMKMENSVFAGATLH